MTSITPGGFPSFRDTFGSHVAGGDSISDDPLTSLGVSPLSNTPEFRRKSSLPFFLSFFSFMLSGGLDSFFAGESCLNWPRMGISTDLGP